MADKKLTRDWINYLKGMQIVKQQSDPSGKLVYNRPVTSDNLAKFLQGATDYDEDTIYSAIEASLKKNGHAPAASNAKPQQGSQNNQQQGSQNNQQQGSQNNQQSKWNTDDAEDVDYKDVKEPGRQLATANNQQQSSNTKQKSKWNTDDAEDVDYKDSEEPSSKQLAIGNSNKKDSSPKLPYSGRPNARGGKKSGIVSHTPDAIRKREARARAKPMNEDIRDESVNLSEKDVENVFDTLQSMPQQKPTATGTPDDINKVKNIIDTKMNKALRKMLWQVLHETNLSEAQINRNQANTILKSVIDNKAYGRLKNKNISLADLQQLWKKAHYSTDTEIIGDLLKKEGFGDTEIHRVFDSVLGGNADYDEDDDAHAPNKPPTPAIVEFGKYIKKHNLQDEVIKYMQSKYGADLEPNQPDEQNHKDGLGKRAMNWAKSKFQKKTATVEEIRQIFTSILVEERSDRELRIKEAEQSLFGRSKK